MLFARFSSKVVSYGRLTIIDADGRTHVAGLGDGPAVTIRLHDKALHYSLALNPTLRFGEAYMDGTLTVEQGDLYDFVELGAANYRSAKNHPLARGLNVVRKALRRLHQHNPAAGRGPMSRITTICRQACTTCSWIPAANTPAPTSPTAMTTSSRLSATRSVTWLPSCCSSRVSGSSTSARDGAGWRCTWPRPRAARCRASRSPKSSSRSAAARGAGGPGRPGPVRAA